jgi:hypothetical protein
LPVPPPNKVEAIMTREQTLKRRTRAVAQDFGDLARDRAQQAIDAVIEAAEERAALAQRTIKRQMKDRPVAITATALGVGVLVGLALRGGGSHAGRH